MKKAACTASDFLGHSDVSVTARLATKSPQCDECLKSKAPGTPRAEVVAGVRYDRVCDLPVPLVLPVLGQVEARAA